MTSNHPTDRKSEPLIDKRLAALGNLTGRLLFLLFISTVLLYAAATPAELSLIAAKDRWLLKPEIIWVLLPSFHLAVITTLLGTMIATRDLIFALEDPHVPDEVPNFFDMFRYQSHEFGYSQVNFRWLSIIPYFAYQLIIMFAYFYGVWCFYSRVFGSVSVDYEIYILNVFLSAIIIIRLTDNVSFKIKRLLDKRTIDKNTTTK